MRTMQPNIDDVIQSVCLFAKAFAVKSTGSLVAGMDTDCYMNVFNWINQNHAESSKDEEKKERIFSEINGCWSFENDSILGQSLEIRDKLFEIYLLLGAPRGFSIMLDEFAAYHRSSKAIAKKSLKQKIIIDEATKFASVGPEDLKETTDLIKKSRNPQSIGIPGGWLQI